MPVPRGITFVQGGFAKVGGIEAFAADLLFALRSREVQAELICWSSNGSTANPALVVLSKSGIRLTRSSWRWGCRWGWPDKAMVLQGWSRFADSEILVFGKLLHPDAHRRLLSLGKRMILITPYRPSEMWEQRRPDPAILNSFESIVVQASFFENDLRTLGYEGRVFTLPYLPPDTLPANPWPRDARLQIGFLGRLVPDKNLDYLIVSFSRLRPMGTDAELHLYGDGPERETLQSLAVRLGLTAHIHFHGALDRSQVPAAIDRCHLFAFSSTTEGQCLAALEVLARGRPVLGTPVGAFPEFLGGLLGSIAPLHDPEAFAAAIQAMTAPVLSGELTPEEVQWAYVNRFQRRQVIEGYLQVFGCPYSKQEETQRV